jgi:proton-translocating NADH-quinone oxidoreductase chain N
VTVAPGVTALPLLFLAGGAAITFLAGRAAKRRSAAVTTAVALAALGLSFATFLILVESCAVPGATACRLVGESSLRADGLGVLLGLLTTGLGFLVILYLYTRGEEDRPLFATLFLLLTFGIVGLGLAGDLFNLYVFFEVMALTSYALVAYRRREPEAVEAGMKYLVMNGAGSIVALMGIGLVYMSSPTGSLELQVLAANTMPPNLAWLAAALLIAGFGVKAAVVPMHTWLPDAYTAAPTGVAAMMGGVVTVSGLLAMVRSLSVIQVDPALPMPTFGLLLAFLAVLTMTVGNLTAMHQKDLKRMLAYSSIAQVGYILLGFGVGFEFGVTIAVVGALFHIVSHGLMKGGAFLAVGVLQSSFGSRDLIALRGAGRRVPLVGAAFGVFVLGLAGVPLTAGFLSKLLIVTGSVQGGVYGVFFAVALIANSVLSLAYYVPALTGLFAEEGAAGPRPTTSRLQVAVVFAMAALVVLFGVWPDPVLNLVTAAAGALGGG